MKSLILIAVLSVASLQAVHAQTSDTTASRKEKIGVYDSRAVAVAYASSSIHNRKTNALMEEHKKAVAKGDKELVAKLEAKGAASQKEMHMQGFSTAPVDSILEQVKDLLPALKEKNNVSVLLSKWDKEGLAKHVTAERFDVTSDLVQLFNPNERQRKYAIDIQKKDPIPLDDAARIND